MRTPPSASPPSANWRRPWPELRQAALTPDTPNTGQDLERKKNLDATAADLAKLAANTDLEQRGQVLDVLAQIDQWRSQDFSREARDAWADLAFPQVRLLTDMGAISAAGAPHRQPDGPQQERHRRTGEIPRPSAR